MSSPAKPDLLTNARCPRCGATFHCGAAEARCACAEVALDAATRAAIAQRYTGCLCGACLAQLQRASAAAREPELRRP